MLNLLVVGTPTISKVSYALNAKLVEDPTYGKIVEVIPAVAVPPETYVCAMVETPTSTTIVVPEVPEVVLNTLFVPVRDF